MNKKPLTEYTNEELQNEIKRRKFLLGAVVGAIAMMIGIAIGTYIKKHEYNFNMVLPLFFIIPAASLMWSEYKKAKDEMGNRNKLGK